MGDRRTLRLASRCMSHVLFYIPGDQNYIYTDTANAGLVHDGAGWAPLKIRFHVHVIV